MESGYFSAQISHFTYFKSYCSKLSFLLTFVFVESHYFMQLKCTGLVFIQEQSSRKGSAFSSLPKQIQQVNALVLLIQKYSFEE